jgi:hypothetical protein
LGSLLLREKSDGQKAAAKSQRIDYRPHFTATQESNMDHRLPFRALLL